ncbi:nucleoporin Nup43 [Aplysia californica]|uniref:Nucleoporin Nup43 n=1 Tax=Aplysia californica TaxID=6500 RepID=A0ABM0JAP2_APLCA|nr:nucleoporin Nup43 [Aplysia californica]
MTDFSVKFVSKKISKVRWRPRANVKSPPSTIFASGSWDDQQNSVSVWKVWDRLSTEDNGMSEPLLEHEPQKIFEIPHVGDVTDMQYMSHDLLAVSSSAGGVAVYKHQPNTEGLSKVCSWDKLHRFAPGSTSPCTCISPRDDDWLVSGGEDGHLNVLALGQREPVQVIEKADSCTINAVTFLKQMEVLTVSSFGQLKIFDLRQEPGKGAKIFSVSEGQHTPLLCVDKHPGQAHVVATGGEDGMLTVWDLRKEKFPMTLLEAHTGAMWEVKFHPHNPHHLFTCSDDGSLWHWDGSAFSNEPMSTFFQGKGKESEMKDVGISSPWLSLETSRQKLDIASLLPNKSLPVNSLDIETSTLLCGTDSETIYSIDLPMLR